MTEELAEGRLQRIGEQTLIQNIIKFLAANYGFDPLFSVAIFVLEVETKAQMFISSSEGRVRDKWLETVYDVYQKAKLL